MSDIDATKEASDGAHLLSLAEQALTIWDAWCPDDGRPARAVAMIKQVLAGPVADAEYEAVYDAMLDSCEMAEGVYPAEYAIQGIGLVLWAVRAPESQGLPYWAGVLFGRMVNTSGPNQCA